MTTNNSINFNLYWSNIDELINLISNKACENVQITNVTIKDIAKYILSEYMKEFGGRKNFELYCNWYLQNFALSYKLLQNAFGWYYYNISDNFNGECTEASVIMGKFYL